MGVLNVLNFNACFFSVLVLLYAVPYASDLLYRVLALSWLVKCSGWLMFQGRKYLLNQKVSSHKKAVLVTGCDSGFGYTVAQRLDKLGYVVYAGCLDKTGEGANSLAYNCSSRLHTIQLDVSNDDHIRQALEYVRQNLGENVLWAVVNNAGVATGGEIDWTPVEEFDRVYDINARGTVKVTKAFLPLIRESKGRIINNSSLCAHLTCPGYVAYCMSKTSAEAFTTGLRMEMIKFGVKAISIEPFFYTTPLTRKETGISLVQKCWDDAPVDVKAVYGEKYIEAFKKCCVHLLKRSCPDVDQVIDCFVDAVTSVDPLNCYSPCDLYHQCGMMIANLFLPILMETYQRLQMPYTVKPAILENSIKEGKANGSCHVNNGNSLLTNGKRIEDEHHSTSTDGTVLVVNGTTEQN